MNVKVCLAEGTQPGGGKPQSTPTSFIKVEGYDLELKYVANASVNSEHKMSFFGIFR